MKNFSKTKALIVCILALSFALPGAAFASSSNSNSNSSGTGFDSPTIKIKEFRETKK